MVKDLPGATNAQLVKEWLALDSRVSEIIHRFCEDGLGNVRLGEILDNLSIHPWAGEYADNLQRRNAIRTEAEMRYGPDLRSVENLTRDQGKSYRRVKAA
jgi:hypothetical protein